MNRGQHIFIIGMMGSGKSSVGQALANILNYSFYDIDEMIVLYCEMSISDIFQEYGESGYRQREKEISRSLPLEKSPSVIATGGGFPLDEENFRWMQVHGRIIWLQAAACTILNRIEHTQNRPLFSADNLIPLMNERTFVYEKADYYISSDGRSIQDIVKEIIKQVIYEEN